MGSRLLLVHAHPQIEGFQTGQSRQGNEKWLFVLLLGTHAFVYSVLVIDCGGSKSEAKAEPRSAHALRRKPSAGDSRFDRVRKERDEVSVSAFCPLLCTSMRKRGESQSNRRRSASVGKRQGISSPNLKYGVLWNITPLTVLVTTLVPMAKK
jgi:hypothetical protein